MAGNYDFQDPIWKCISPEGKHRCATKSKKKKKIDY